MAHIQKRGPGQYRARYIDPQGRERSKTFSRKADAETFLTEVSHAVRAGSYVDPVAGRMTVRDYAETWRQQQDHRASTASNLETRLRRHVYPALGDRTLASLQPSDMRAWQAATLKVLAASTTASLRGQVVAMLDAAVLDRRIPSNPLRLIRAPKVTRPPLVPPTVDQVAIIEGEILPRYRALVTLVKGSGLRWGEAAGLTEDRFLALRREVKVDRQLLGRRRGVPVFGPPKTESSYRVVPIADVTVQAVAAHIARWGTGPAGLIFTTMRGGPLTRDMFGQQWRPARDAAGMSDGDGLHTIRHFYASLLIANGASVKEVQARMGHKSAMETLDTYGHLFPDADESTRARMTRALAPLRKEHRGDA